jgi:hypothetical protein
VADFTNCSAGCRVGGHATWGQCVRNKATAVMGLESTGNGIGGYTADKKMTAENAAYSAARAEGLQPAAPTHAAVDAVRKAADVTGTANGRITVDV